MNVVDLIREADSYIGKKVTVVGILDRPRKKHSNYLFFNIEQDGEGVQAIVKKDELGPDRFKEIVYGLSHKNAVIATGRFNLRNSSRDDFYKYEITITDIRKV